LILKNIQNYYSAPNKYYMDKIIAMNLIFATFIKTFAQRSKYFFNLVGVTELKINDSNQIAELIRIIFIQEFEQNGHILAKIYSFKFLTTFRLQIPLNWLQQIITMLVNIINSSDNVVANAAILALEKILFMKDVNNSTSLATEAVNDTTIFPALFKCLVNAMSVSNNLFAMRCFFRTIYLASDKLLQPDIQNLATSIDALVINAIKNSSEDNFNYYLFETIATLLKRLASLDASLYTYFESIIRVNLIKIIQENVTDLIGYAFQIFSFEYYISGDNIDPIFGVRVFLILGYS
jgi:hypothetical protein